MKSKESCKTIIYLLCIGHPGFTLIGNVLGSHSKVFHIGEFIAPMQREHEIQCQYCGDSNCEIWGGILKKDFLKKIYNGFKFFNTRNRYLRRLRLIFNIPPGGETIYSII